MRKVLDIEVRGMELRVEVEVSLEDIGIGHWECHGRGYHSDVVVVTDDLIYNIEMDDYARANKVHTFDYDKLNERNRSAIDEAVREVVGNLCRWEIEREMREDAA